MVRGRESEKRGSSLSCENGGASGPLQVTGELGTQPDHSLVEGIFVGLWATHYRQQSCPVSAMIVHRFGISVWKSPQHARGKTRRSIILDHIEPTETV